jgi:hypothetical protein
MRGVPTSDDPLLTKHWEHFPHDADIGVRGVGTSKEWGLPRISSSARSKVRRRDIDSQPSSRRGS